MHKYVSGLRRALSGTAPRQGVSIDNGRTGYRLVAATDQVDLSLFHAHVESARSLRAHPLEENLAELLMIALYRAGHTARAIMAYERLHRRLAGELGMAPQPALQDLARAIRGHEPVPNDIRCGVLRGALC